MKRIGNAGWDSVQAPGGSVPSHSAISGRYWSSLRVDPITGTLRCSTDSTPLSSTSVMSVRARTTTQISGEAGQWVSTSCGSGAHHRAGQQRRVEVLRLVAVVGHQQQIACVEAVDDARVVAEHQPGVRPGSLRQQERGVGRLVDERSRCGVQALRIAVEVELEIIRRDRQEKIGEHGVRHRNEQRLGARLGGERIDRTRPQQLTGAADPGECVGVGNERGPRPRAIGPEAVLTMSPVISTSVKSGPGTWPVTVRPVTVISRSTTSDEAPAVRRNEGDRDEKSGNTIHGVDSLAHGFFTPLRDIGGGNPTFGRISCGCEGGCSRFRSGSAGVQRSFEERI